MESVPATQIVRGVEYDLCSCCNKPIRGSGRKCGGAAIFVVKAFLRGGQRVNFPDDWKKLCEAVGFRQTHHIKAWQTSEHGSQKSYDGKDKRFKKKKASFFRILSERKAAEKNYFNSLDRSVQTQWIDQASNLLWSEYNQLTPEQKAEMNDKQKHVHPKPSSTQIKQRAMKIAFAESGERADAWNEDIRIDFEEVLVFRKVLRDKENIV